MSDTTKALHAGHRERIRDKLYEQPQALQDHELLEIILFGVYRRRNTNHIAHNLLKRFGDLDGVFAADRHELLSVSGVGQGCADYLRCIGELYESYSEISQKSTPTGTIACENFAAYAAKLLQKENNGIMTITAFDREKRIVGEKAFVFENYNKFSAPIIVDFIEEFKSESAILCYKSMSGEHDLTISDRVCFMMTRLIMRRRGTRLDGYFVTHDGKSFFDAVATKGYELPQT